jgi:hypothetical protein
VMWTIGLRVLRDKGCAFQSAEPCCSCAINMHACWGGQEGEEPAVTHENYPHFGGHACGRDSLALLTRGLRSCQAARCQQRGQHYHAPAAGDPRTAVRRHARRHHFLLVSHSLRTHNGLSLGSRVLPTAPNHTEHPWTINDACIQPLGHVCVAPSRQLAAPPVRARPSNLQYNNQRRISSAPSQYEILEKLKIESRPSLSVRVGAHSTFHVDMPTGQEGGDGK